MKVYLQYPWKFPDSPYYKSLVNNAPDGVKFIFDKEQKGVITNKKFFRFSNFLKKVVRKAVKTFPFTVPNAHLSPEGDYDLIHAAHCLSKNLNKPWVCDIEMIGSLSVADLKNKGSIRKILLRDNCRKIMPWTEYTRDTIVREFPEVKGKVEVVYPAVPEVKNLGKEKGNKLEIIFVARYFGMKGGVIALEVMERLRKKYGAEGIVVSDVPEKLKKKYSELKIYDLIPQDKLFELMRESDLFLYPGSIDTFGFSLLEAMSFGLPTLTINTFGTKSRKEIIEDGKTGFIFDVEEKLSWDEIGEKEELVIRKLVENAGKLIEDKGLRERMRRNCLEEIRSGKFSIRKRNEKLTRIYEEAVK